MKSDYSSKGYTWRCTDGTALTDVLAKSPEAQAAMQAPMQKLRELAKLGSNKGNLFRPAFKCNYPGHPCHIPINLSAFPERTVDFAMHLIEPGYGFPIHLHDYASETYLVIGGQGKVMVEDDLIDAEINDVFYVTPGKWHTAFNPADNTQTFQLFVLQSPRVSDELKEMGYVEITKSQWDQLGLPKKEWEKT